MTEPSPASLWTLGTALAEIDRLRADLATAQARIAELQHELATAQICDEQIRKRCERAEAAQKLMREELEPFAKEADLFRNPGWKETDLCDGTDRLTVGDLRRARAVLNAEPAAADREGA